jgi:parallel beta-helix repeat protein
MKTTRFAVTAMVFAVLTLLATGLANAQPPKCDTTITACGCTIGVAGSYTVANELYASQGLTVKNGCIDIEGSNVHLDVGYYIIGPGSDSNCDGTQPEPHLTSGVGIHVLPTASSVYINGAQVCGWNSGVESEGNNVTLYETGAYINNVGVFLNNATANNVGTTISAANVTGFEISGGSGNSITESVAEHNSQYGFWVDGSKGNTVSDNVAGENNIAGFYLGCSSKGVVNPLIPCTTTTTTGNTVDSNVAVFNNKYGIAVERDSIYNEIEDNLAIDDTKYDMADGNGNCVYNTYLKNTYGTKNLPCIQ